ncbi:MAG: bifunctional alpha,alpha-trehalose-phosphate synthase (UDP-forming)/trehalose-phosphatase [Candidatus Saccharibacteria bacterium]
MHTHDFVVVSNRLPVSVTKEHGELVFTPSSGGLATAMSSLDSQGSHTQNRLWIGWPGIASDDLTPHEKTVITRTLRAHNCVPVFLSRDQIKNFYEGYANDTLWPLFHYFQSVAQFGTEYWSAYQSVNKLYAKAVARVASPTATIWVHDYHLMLLPRLIRHDIPGSAICFFLHIPFPSYEIFRLLPERQDILEGLLGADLIGFHTYDYARYFMSSVLRTLGHENHNGEIPLDDHVVHVDAFPIGIDYQKFTLALNSPAVQSEVTMLREHYKDQQIILSVDRLDYSKGIAQRLRAFEDFLQQNPKYHKKVSLIIIAVPSRTEVQAYKDLRDAIEQAVSRINGNYATVDWTPISYQFKNLPFEQIVALFSAADVALVTPMRDGMNLVAKEYVASKQHTPGVLILSELTGAADELQEAISVSPNDSKALVRAIKTALTMPKREQEKRMQSMQQRISQYTLQRWANDMIEQLNYSKQLQAGLSSKALSPDDRAKIIAAAKRATHRMIFLDYDGTLMPFVDSPEAALSKPTARVTRLLTGLATLPNTELCIVSGRSREALQSWFKKLPITLVAEHGAWIRQNGEWAQGLFSFQEYKKTLLPILEHFAERTPGAIIEEKNFALVWHYRNVSPELAYARNASLRHELGLVLGDTDIGVFAGTKILEIKPRDIQKGAIVGELLAERNPDFILCAGDDYTDEDMFTAVPESAVTIKIGHKETAAQFQAASIEELRSLLETIARSSQ